MHNPEIMRGSPSDHLDHLATPAYSSTPQIDPFLPLAPPSALTPLSTPQAPSLLCVRGFYEVATQARWGAQKGGATNRFSDPQGA